MHIYEQMNTGHYNYDNYYLIVQFIFGNNRKMMDSILRPIIFISNFLDRIFNVFVSLTSLFILFLKVFILRLLIFLYSNFYVYILQKNLPIVFQ